MKRVNILISVFFATICCVCANEPQKRAPSGFTGVRGKKSIPEEAYSEPTQTLDDGSGQEEVSHMGRDSVDIIADSLSGTVMDKRTPSGFLGMRGKKPSNDWAAPQQQEYSMGYFKRAPSGFLGMRGKKENVYGDEYYKRAPSGFLGMRGKKDYDLLADSYDEYTEKRAPSGFHGMRGKKEYDTFLEEIKRAPSGFFGMRGKKLPGRSGFFGTRGKKYPYEFRGKFVGVRGKKISNEVTGPDYSSQTLDEQLQSLGDDLDLNQLMLLLTDNESWEAARTNGYNPEQQQMQN